MLNLTLEQIAQYSKGQLNDPKYKDIVIDTISIDTRTISKGDMYMPIIGEKLDGHLFIDQAFEKGAVAAFSEKNRVYEDLDKPFIYVDNSNQAFADLAKNYRDSLEDIKIVGITGSNGKTTTKDYISLTLQESFNVAKTIGNLNNHIGVPRTLLRFDKDTDVGVVEMGTDGFGQIDYLTHMVKPDIAILTNVGDAHLHLLKSKELVAREKVDIINGLPDDGIFIYNYDNEYIRNEIKTRNIRQRIITFGQDPESDYVIEIISTSSKGNTFKLNGETYMTASIGSHQIYNATCAIIVSRLFNIDQDIVRDQLKINERTSMRSELMTCRGFDILNDSYKSNPQSLVSALETLDILSGYKRKIAIIGDMLELGENEEEIHRQVGRIIDPKKVDYLLCTGPLSKFIAEEAKKRFPFEHVFHLDKKNDLIDKAKYLIQKNSLVLVKASRSLRLEEVVDSLRYINLS